MKLRDVGELKQKKISAVIKNINNRPLKCLSYQTPDEMFRKHT